MSKEKPSDELRVAAAQIHNDQQLRMFDSVMTSAVNTIKILLLINGAAAVAVGSFLGVVIGKTLPPMSLTLSLSNSLLSFGGGVLSCAIAAVFFYFAQYNFKEKLGSKGSFYRNLSIVFVWVSILAFIAGLGFSYYSFRTSV